MFMYWQVYNHKSSFSAEVLVTQALRRAKELSEKGEDLFATEAFSFFLKTNINKSINERLEHFTQLDDSDIWTSLKVWQHHDDKILSYLSSALINRRLPVSKILNKELSEVELEEMKLKIAKEFQIEDASYFVHQAKIKVTPYDKNDGPIYIMDKSKKLHEISDSPLQILSHHLLTPIQKFHLCYIDVKKYIP